MFHRHQTEAVPNSSISLVQLTPALNHCRAPISGQSWCHSRANYKGTCCKRKVSRFTQYLAFVKWNTLLPGPNQGTGGVRTGVEDEKRVIRERDQRDSVHAAYLLCNLYLAVTFYYFLHIPGNRLLGGRLIARTTQFPGRPTESSWIWWSSQWQWLPMWVSL